VFKKNYIAFIISGVIHLVILLFLLKGEPSLPQIKEEKKSFIKSYLYTLPKQENDNSPKKEDVVTQDEKSTFIKTSLAKTSEAAKPEKSLIVTKKSTISKDTQKILSSAIARVIEVEIPEKPQKNKANFSAYNKLEKLKLSINNKIMEDNLTAQRHFKPAPVINAEADPVPHSITKTEIDSVLEGVKRMQLTATSYGNTTIFKDENGICTSVTDLSFLGTGPMKKTTRSRCGKSKFDKNFSFHMKSVLKKLGK